MMWMLYSFRCVVTMIYNFLKYKGPPEDPIKVLSLPPLYKSADFVVTWEKG